MKRSFEFRVSSFKSGAAVFTLCLLSALPLCALDRNAFSFTQYDLKVQIDPATSGFTADGKVVLRNDSNQPQHSAVLQISSSLDWKSIQSNGKPILHVTHSLTSDTDHTGQLSEAVVTFPQDIPPKGTVELEISYGGVIKKDSTRLEQAGAPKDVAANSEWDEIAENFSAVRGAGFVLWYPVATDAVSIADGSSYSLVMQKWKNRELSSQFKLEACSISANPKGALMVFGGSVQTLSQQTSAGKSTNQSTSKKEVSVLSCASFPQITSGFSTPSFVLGALERLSVEDVNAAIVYPSGQTQIVGEYTPLMKPTELLVHNWFGGSKRAVLIVGLPDAHDAPWESGDALFTPLKRSPKAAGLSLAHQFTHAAFASPRPWIYEGLAHFAQALQVEAQDGRAAALDYMAQQLPGIVDDETENLEIAHHAQRGPVSITFTSLAAGNDEVLYRSKAMYVWWMLRDMLGDAVLQHALAKYHPEEDTDPAYLQHLLEAEAKAGGTTANLDAFFNDWVYHDRGLPNFHVASTYARPVLSSGTANGYLVTVTIENLGDAGAEVPLTLTAANKETIAKRLMVPADGKASIRIPTQNQPQAITVNDSSVPETDSKNNSAEIKIESSSQ